MHVLPLLPPLFMTTQDQVDEMTHGEALLRAMDGQVKLALQAQVGIAASVDAFLTVLHLFRAALADIPLPPPSAVDLGQALKDAQRETIVLNGRAFQVCVLGVFWAVKIAKGAGLRCRSYLSTFLSFLFSFSSHGRATPRACRPRCSGW